MCFLTDSELKRLFKADSLPIRGIEKVEENELDSINSQIQPCSIDLRISEIFLPSKNNKKGPATRYRTNQYQLGVGESVKITTRETFDLGNAYGGLLLAPARLTRRGIIVPDIGHIDPGFKGDLRITLINMGRHPYELKSGDTIATVLLFRLAEPCAVGLRDRKGAQPYATGLEDIEHLAPDFLLIEKRAQDLSRKEAKAALGQSGWKFAFLSVFLPIVLGILTAFVAYYFQVRSGLDDFKTSVNAKLDALEKKSDALSEVRKLETTMNDKLNEIRRELDRSNQVNATQRGDRPRN